MDGPQLSLIIPAYNEARRLPETLDKVAAFCETLPVRVEVIVVVEKSEDETLLLARQAACKHPYFQIVGNTLHRGKGYAVRCGMLKAEGEILLFMDADLSVPLQEIPVFLAYFAQHPEVDILAGSRKHAQSRILKRQSPLRERMGATFNWILRKVVGIGIRDTQCGFKAFRREAAHRIFALQQLDGFAFDVEVLLLADRLDYCIQELPVEWINAPDSHINIIRDSLQMLRDTLLVKGLVQQTQREHRNIL